MLVTCNSDSSNSSLLSKIQEVILWIDTKLISVT